FVGTQPAVSAPAWPLEAAATNPPKTYTSSFITAVMMWWAGTGMGFLWLQPFVAGSKTYTTPNGLPVFVSSPASTYHFPPATAPAISPTGWGSGGAVFHSELPNEGTQMNVAAMARVVKRDTVT